MAIKAGFVASDYKTTYDRVMVINKLGVLVHKGVLAAGNDINNAVAAINQSLLERVEVDCQGVAINVSDASTPPSCPGESVHGCKSDTSNLNVSINAVGIGDRTEQVFATYPNPVHDTLQISRLIFLHFSKGFILL